MRSIRGWRPIVLLLTAATVGVAGMPAALAVPPANDDFANATVVTEPLPFTDAINTSEATTASDDPDCVGQGPTVWYAYTPSTSFRVEGNTFGSDYDTTLSAYTGTQGALTQIACNDDAGGSLQSRVRFDVTAGTPIFFMVGAFASGPGGNLEFMVQEAPPAGPPLEIDVTIDPVGSVVPKTGVATISGTVSCSREAFVDLFGELRQRFGRLFIRGFIGEFFLCTGEESWSATAHDANGLFVPGRARVMLEVFAFDEEEDDFAFEEVEAMVRLRPVRG